MVKEAWDRGGSDAIRCLEEVRVDSIKFNIEVFGNIFRRKKDLEARIASIQKSLETWDSSSLEQLERQLRQEYDVVLAQEELI